MIDVVICAALIHGVIVLLGVGTALTMDYADDDDMAGWTAKTDAILYAPRASAEIQGTCGWSYVAQLSGDCWAVPPEDQELVLHEFGPDGAYLRREQNNVRTIIVRAYPEQFPAAVRLFERMHFAWFLEQDIARQVCEWLNQEWPQFERLKLALVDVDRDFEVKESGRRHLHRQ